MTEKGAPDIGPVWHALPVAQVLRHFDLDAQQGLCGDEALARQARHGPNALPEAPARPLWRTFARQFKSPLIYILLVAAVLAGGLGHLGDALVILAVVLINALIGSFQEGRAERSMAALRRLSALHVRVLRDGAEQSIEARELVPGDLVLLAAGDAVVADARLIDAAQLQVAEAALTGESVPVSKSVAALPEATTLADRHCMVYSGTHVTAGRARAVGVATGMHTEVGRIAGLTEPAEEPRPPLELRLEGFGRALVGVALGLFVLVVLLGLWRELPLSEVLMVAISQMVSMVPEGLPVAMTIALAVGMQRMAGRGAIIRRLSAVETLGSTTVICSDKTGTLTRNEMTVSALWLPGGRQIDVSGAGYAPQGALSVAGTAVDPRDAAVAALLRAAALCNDAELVPPQDDITQWTVLGDPTEAALLVAAGKAGIEVSALRRQSPREAELPFDAAAKMMATRHADPTAPRRVYVKGAPEAVLRLCGADGSATLQAAREAADAMAGRALRVLAVATVADDRLDSTGGFDALAGRATLQHRATRHQADQMPLVGMGLDPSEISNRGALGSWQGFQSGDRLDPTHLKSIVRLKAIAVLRHQTHQYRACGPILRSQAQVKTLWIKSDFRQRGPLTLAGHAEALMPAPPACWHEKPRDPLPARCRPAPAIASADPCRPASPHGCVHRPAPL